MARHEYVQAAGDPAVAAHGGVEMNEAQRALNKAEAKQEDGEEGEARHFAKVAETNVETAKAVAQAKTAEQQTKQLEAELAELKTRVTTQGIVVTLSDVYFEVDSAQLRPTAMQDLGRLAAFLNANPQRSIAIEGHTDSTGTDAYNRQLSQLRAESVKAFLAANGVSPARVFAQGFGESFPVASNSTDTGRATNRRVEMLILNPGEVVRMSSAPIIQQSYTITTR